MSITLTVFIIVLIIPLIITPVKIANPFLILAIYFFLFIIGKFLINNAYGIDFMLGQNKAKIIAELNYWLYYIIISYITAAAFIFYRKSIKIKTVIPEYDDAGKRKEPPFFYIRKSAYYIAIGLPIIIIGIIVLKGINPISQTYQVRLFTQSQGMLYFLIVILFFSNLSIILFLNKIRNKKIPSLKIIVAAFVSIGYALVSGLSSTIVTCVASYFIFLSAYKRISIERFIIIFLPIIMLYATFHNQYRLMNMDSNNISITEFANSAEINDETFFRIFNRFDYLEMYCKGHQYISSYGPDYGMSLLAGTIQFVPRAIWPTKPENTSTFFSRKIIPEVMDEVGSTANFNSLNEFTRAFGVWGGIIIGGIVFGLILGYVYVHFKISYYEPYAALFHTIVLFYAFYTGFIAGYINDQGVQLLIINSILFKIFIRKNNPVNK